MSSIHIIISGASSTGKTTLVEECLSHLTQYSFTQIREVARTVLNRLNLTGKDLIDYVKEYNLDKFLNVQKMIVEEQIVSFDREKDKNYLSDRSGFDALAYIHYYFQNQQKTKELFQNALFQLLIQQCQTGLIFIIQPQKELQAKNDNMRIVPNFEEQIGYTDCLKYWYEQAHLPYFVIEDLNLTKRVEFIQQHIEGHFRYPSVGIPIPLCLPFHLNRPDSHSLIRLIKIPDKQNIHISYQENRLDLFNKKFVMVSFHPDLDQSFIQKVLKNNLYINGEEYRCTDHGQLENGSYYLVTDLTD